MADETLEDSSDPEKSARGKVARLMVRALWQAEWSTANPEAKAEARKEAWKLAKEGRSEHVNAARKALRIMEKRGVTLTIAPDANLDADEE